METAITESFMKSVQVAVDECLEKVKEESRKFAAALGAVRHLPTASPVVPVPDTSHLEHRIAALELAYQRQVQKTIAGLSEDIGDLDGRLASLERASRPDVEDVSAWTWPGPSKKNEVVVIDDRSTVCDFGLGDVLVNVNHVDDDVEMLTAPVAITVPSPVVASVTTSVPAPAPVPAPASASVTTTVPAPVIAPIIAPIAPAAEAEEEEEEEESEPLELDEFEYEGVTYYKDPDNNVYKPNDDGEVDAESPVGRWLEKKQTLKLY